MSDSDIDVDFAVAAWREEGLWRVEPLPPRIGEQFDTLVSAGRAQPGEGGVLGMVSVEEEFFVLVRVLGEDVLVLASDVYAAEEWPIGLAALEPRAPRRPPRRLRRPRARRRPAHRREPPSGLGVEELELLLDDPELYPDEQLAGIASRLGFGDQFDSLLESLDAPE